MNSYVSQTAEQHLSALAEQVKRLRSNGIPSDGVLELLDEIERAADLVTRDEEVARPEHPFPDSEQLYRAIGEVVPDFLWSCTAKGVPVFANRRWHDYTGISFDPADGISMDVIPMDVLHHPLDYPRLVATWTKSRTDRTPYECEFRLRRRDGVYRWFHVRCIPIFDPTGEVTHWIGTTTDVHESKLVQESLESSEDRFRTTFEQVAVGIVHFSPTGEWIRVNQRFCDMVGYERDELLRTRFQNITHPDDFDIDMPQLREMLFGRLRHYTVEKRYIHKSGDLVWVNIWVSMVVDVVGAPDYLIGVIEDITAHKTAEVALVKRISMSAIVAEVGAALTQDIPLQSSLQCCTDAILNHLDAALVRIWMVDSEELRPHLYSSAGSDRSASGSRSPIRSSHRHINHVVATRVQYFTNAAREDPLIEDQDWVQREAIESFVGTPLVVGDTLLGVLCLFARRKLNNVAVEALGSVADIIGVGIQRRQAESALKALNSELEQRVADRTSELDAAVKELDSFSYTVSHDLRAPLRGINGFTRALLTDYLSDLPDQAQHYLQRVNANAQKMSDLIDDLLAFSHLGRKTLKRGPVAIDDVIRPLIAEMLLEHSGRNVRVDIQDLPVCDCDATLIRQVFANLLSNAFKYTGRAAEPKIEVGCQRNNGELVIYVKDNGVGFDMQYAHKLFGVFQRLHRAEDFAGTGVGLAIVQRLVLRHGGRVWAYSEVGNGATFYVALRVRGASTDDVLCDRDPHS